MFLSFSFMTKRTHLSQKMMRARVAAQGLTVLALLGGVVINMRQKYESKEVWRNKSYFLIWTLSRYIQLWQTASFCCRCTFSEWFEHLSSYVKKNNLKYNKIRSLFLLTFIFNANLRQFPIMVLHSQWLARCHYILTQLT